MAEVLTVRWEHHKTSFVGAFEYLRNTDMFSDVTLACDGRVYKLHKVILSIFSDYLGNIFQELSFPNNAVIILRDTSYQDLESLLDYMYFGEVEIQKQRLDSFLRAGEYLKVKGIATTTKQIPNTKVNKIYIAKTSVPNRQVSAVMSEPNIQMPTVNICGNEPLHHCDHSQHTITQKRTQSPKDQAKHKTFKVGISQTAETMNSPISSVPERISLPNPSLLETVSHEKGIFSDGGISGPALLDQSLNINTTVDIKTTEMSSPINLSIPAKSEVADEPSECNDDDITDESYCKMEFVESPISPFAMPVEMPEESSELNDIDNIAESGCKMEFVESGISPFEESTVCEAMDEEKLDPLSTPPVITRDIADEEESPKNLGFQITMPMPGKSKPCRLLLICPYCSSRYTTSSELRAHVHTHTNNMPFLCPHCPTRDSDKDTIARHMADAHQDHSNKVIKKPPHWRFVKGCAKEEHHLIYN